MENKLTYTGDQVAAMLGAHLRAAVEAAIEASLNFREPTAEEFAEMGEFAKFYNREDSIKMAIMEAAYAAAAKVEGPACVECDGFVEYL